MLDRTVYHMALRLYSLVRHKDYKIALELCATLSEHLKEITKEKDNA